MNSLGIILKALFKNKLRFGDGASKKKKIGLFAAFAVVYIFALVFVIMLTIIFGYSMALNGLAIVFYLILLLIASGIVLIFGIINLVSVLYLSKDTDFYSMLPIKSTVVFIAKLLYVYLLECALVVLVVLPALITFGVLINAWVGYYIISIISLAVIPAIPLFVAAIFAIPIMYIAGKLKNRNVIPLIFYTVLFLGFFGLYMWAAMSVSSLTGADQLTTADFERIARAINIVGYILYPFLCISSAALGIPSFGLSVEASIAVNIIIFVAISVVLSLVLILLGKFMYGQSVKANNQTDNSKTKQSDYKTRGWLKALIKREYQCAFRSTQTAFQCFGVLFMPIMFAVLFSISIGRSVPQLDGSDLPNAEQVIGAIEAFFSLLPIIMTVAILPVVGNAAITSFSREGAAIESLKILPIRAKQLILAKSLSWGIFAIPSSIIAAVVINVFNFNISNLLLTIFAFILLSGVFIVFGVLWDLKSPKLKWTDPMQAVKHNTHAVIGQLLEMCGGFVVAIVSIILLFVGLEPTVINAVCWSLIFSIVLIFAIADILIYRGIETYYNRIEI